MFDERQRELYTSFARSGVRSVRRRLRNRGRSVPADHFCPARVGDFELRLLRADDGPGWTASMRANEERMRPWWPATDDWQKATDAVAFADHYLQWRRRTREGSGLCAVVAGPTGVLGEITLWNLAPGALVGEAGVWLYPRVSRRFFLPLWAAFFDNCFGNLGLTRVTSPVAAGNANPLRLISEIGASHVATMPGAGSVATGQCDLEIYSISREEWLAHRLELARTYPWPSVAPSLPPLPRP